MSRAQTLLVFAAIGAVGVLGTLTFAFISQNQIDVYFDNGLASAVTVSVDGESFTLLNRVPQKRRLGTGSHEIVVSSEAGEIERTRIEIEKKSLMAALLERGFYVYNVSQAHIYRRAQHTFAVQEADRAYSEQIIAFQQFFPQADADYLFTPAPNQITIEGDSALRDEFVVASDLDYNVLATMRMGEGNSGEARKAVDKALELDPCYADAFRTRVLLQSTDGETPQAVAEAARAFIGACQDAGPEAHRAYQDTMIEFGDREAIRLEYRKRRERDPSSENDYLLGRLASGEEALALYRSALEKDSLFARARLALVWEFLSLERYAEALSETDVALQGKDLVSDAAYLYGFAAVGAGRAEDAESRLSAVAPRLPSDFGLWRARWTTTLARQDWVSAEQLLQEYRNLTGTESFPERIHMLQLRREFDRAQQEIDERRGSPEHAPEAEPLRFELLFQKGLYDEAVRCAAEFPGGPVSLYELYAAAGLFMSGRVAEAEAKLLALDQALLGEGSDEDRFFRTASLALRGRASEEETLSAAREAGFQMLPHAYFLLGAYHHGAGQAPVATTFFRKSAETALSLDFPYLAAKSLSGT